MDLSNIDAGWLWLIGGVILLIAEVIAPGFFLIFIGASAIATGLFTLLFHLSLPLQLVLFVIYLLLALMAGRRFYAASRKSSDPLLNDRAGRLIGKTVTVVAAVDEHHGRVRVGDGEWTARGGPAAVGERVRITGVDGNCLTVEAERKIPSE